MITGCSPKRLWMPLRGLLLGLLMLSPLSAYYHFLHVRSDGGTTIAIPERFDLREFPDQAVPYTITRVAEPELADGDSWEAIVSQIQHGADQWAKAPHSSLRLRYAGEVEASEGSATPRVEVSFEELAPGVIAMGGPVSRGEIRRDGAGEFVPITKSVVVMSNRLRDRPGYSEAFYLTLVHEMGHALGLQHTFTSGVMSTGVTRATTKARPLAADDHAGIASLYPGPHFANDTGVIRGRVQVDGNPLHFAPVTAIQPSGTAVSSITLADGRYEIRGVPPGSYYVYSQPAPPSTQEGLGPGQIVLPVDEAGNSVPPGPLYGTRFFPGVAEWTDAHAVPLNAGSVAEAIDLDVPRRDSQSFTGVTTYSFPGAFAVNPAVVNANAAQRFFVAYGDNLIENQQKASGLEVDALGAWIPNEEVFAYPPAPDFLQLNISLHPFSQMGPRALVWKRGGETYVQPAGFLLVGGPPPGVTSAESIAGEDGASRIRIAGDELGAAYGFLLDGLPAPDLDAFAESANTQAEFRMPFTSDGRPVRVTALGRDGQSSLFLASDAPTAESQIAPSGPVRVFPSVIAPGQEAMLTIESDAPLFASGRLSMDFGSPSLSVRRVWRDAPNRIRANVVAMPGAPIGDYLLTVQRDLAFLRTGAVVSVSHANGLPLSLDSVMTDTETGDSVIYPGARAVLRVRGDVAPESLRLSLAGETVNAFATGQQEYELVVPGSASAGPAVLQVLDPAESALPVVVEIAEAPPAILELSVTNLEATLPQSSQIPLRFRVRVRLPGVTAETLSTRALELRVNGFRALLGEVHPLEGTADEFSATFDIRLPAAAGSADAGVQLTYAGRRSTSRRVSVAKD